MKWTDEEVARGVAAAINAGLHDLPLGVVTVIMTATAELLEARGGTMTADDVEEWLGYMDSAHGDTSPLRQHLTAQGARNAALDQHISELEKSLENARKERDAALRDRDAHATNAEVWRKRVHDAAEALADVLPGEVGRLDLLARISDLKRQRDEALARLKPSGQVSSPEPYEPGGYYSRWTKEGLVEPSEQVAEDERLVLCLLPPQVSPATEQELRIATSALTRLAAKAQGYEAAVAQANTLQHHVDHYDARLTEARNALRDAGVPDESGEVPHHHVLSVAQRIAILANQRDAAVAALNDAAQRDWTCAYCDATFAEPDPCRAHAQTCEKNPLVQAHAAAVADNAALAKRLREALSLVQSLPPHGHEGDEESGQHEPDCEQCAKDALGAMLEDVLAHPHPGTALLERMKRLEAVLDLVRSEAKMLADNGRIQIQAIGHGLLAMMKPLDGH